MSISTPTSRIVGSVSNRFGTFEIAIATAPARLSPYQISKGVQAETGVWLMQRGRCVLNSTVSRVLANPSTCAEAIVGAGENCEQIAALVREAA